MKNKILPALLLVILGCVGVFSCKKHNNASPVDNSPTVFYPLQIGKYITYAVDSTYYIDYLCTTVIKSSQIRYSISDTTVDTSRRDLKIRPTYIIDVSINQGNGWVAEGPILVTPTDSTIIYNQSTLTFIKLVNPVINGLSWKGNSMVNTNDSSYMYMLGLDYIYSNNGEPYNNGFVNFGNTITVTENNVSIPNTGPSADSIAYKFRSYGKEVYAKGVGMIYREYTHLVLDQSKAPCVNGYTVIMRAIEHN